MIENEKQLRISIQSVARMYDICDRIANQTVGDPETRDDEIESVQIMIRKIERELAEYLAAKYAITPAPAEKVA